MSTFDRRKFSRAGKKAAGKRGLVILNIGDGKGKTTAAIGIAVRAHGAGLRVCVLQFMKSLKWKSFERQALQELKIPVQVLGTEFVGIIDDTHPLTWHKQSVKAALAKAETILRSQRYDVVIADEIITAVDEKFCSERAIIGLLNKRPPAVHLVMTGHSRHPAIEKHCDTITEMKNIKHPYYTEGLLAQRGIDF